MFRAFFLLLFYFLLINIANAQRVSLLSLDDLESQRNLFLKAEKALSAGEIKKFKLHSFELTDYPLYPYLQYDYLLYKIGSTSLEEIKLFEKKYPDFPKTGRLREAWLNAQADQGKWKAFLAEYEPTNTISLQCRALYARYLIENDNMLLQSGLNFWLVGHSQPGACNALFDLIKQAGILNKSHYWKRIALALDQKNRALVNHLKPNFSKAEQALINTWIKILEKPTLIQNKHTFQDFKGDNQAHIKIIVTQALTQHALTNPFGTMQLLDYAKTHYALSKAQLGAVQKSIALSLSVKRSELAQQWLDKIPFDLLDKSIYELQIRHAIKQQNWKRLVYFTAHLPVKLKKTKRWRFWHAYALRQLGYDKEATNLFTELAPLRDYYGFLASEQLNKKVSFQYSSHDLKKIDPRLINQVSVLPHMMRTRELIQLNRFRASRSEWHHAISSYSEAQRQAAAHIAYQMKWYDLGILALSKAKHKDNLVIRFPLAYAPIFMQEAKQNQLEPAWLYAVSRQESAFTRDAYSSSGAIGLMQLMPSTAHYIAQKIAFNLSSPADLIHAGTNVKLGAAYLRYLSNKTGHNPVLIAASYNAGPGRAKSWLPNKQIPAVEWIETVPIKETREYIKNVITYISIYRELLAEEGGIQDLMRPIPPTYSGETQVE